MTKLSTPLLSLKASGTIGDAITFQKRSRVSFAREKPIPTDRKSDNQLWHRYLYRQACQYWNALTETQKLFYRKEGSKRGMPGFALFMRQELDRLTHLICCLPFDENHGTTAYDMRGKRHHGVIYGASWTTGKYNSCLYYDGNDDYTQIPTLTTIPPLFSYELWVYPQQQAAWNAILNKPRTGFSHQPCVLVMKAGTTIQYYHSAVGDTWEHILASITVPLINTWYHIIVTYDGSIERLYINGTLEDSNPAAHPRVSTDSFRIGLNINYPLESLMGKADSFRMYDCALSAAEAVYHYGRKEK